MNYKKEKMKTQNKFLVFATLIVFILLAGYFFIYPNGITGEVILNLKITKSSEKISTFDVPGALESFDNFGFSVASIGDLDGDNITDIVVGATGDDDGNPNAGAVYVLFMDTDGTVKSNQKISNNSGNFKEGPLGNLDEFGKSVTSIGDLDGDNITDIVVGAVGDDDGGGSRGAVYILFMYQNGTVNTSQKISDTQGNFLETLDNSDNFGRSVTSIGDLDGNGITDIVVGAQGDDDEDSGTGAVYVLFMNTNGTVNTSQKISDTQGNFLETLDVNDLFGISVASIGDLDGDNITDIVVGAQQDDDGGTDRGAVYVLFMNTNGTVNTSQKISDTQGNFLEILNDSDEFGISVASIGDLDGDNITDIVVGAQQDDDGGTGRGAVYVLFMNTNGTVKSSQKISDTAGNFLETFDNTDLFGSSVASIGDLDGDNITDIVVGAFGDDDGSTDRGAVYVLFLSELNSPNITLNSPTSNSNPSNPVTFNGTVVDSSGISNVSLILDGIYNETNSSGINNTNYIFTKTLSEGTHNWTYEVCDTIDNCINSTVLTFTIDTTNPTATFTCSPSVAILGDTITCTCSGTDSGSGVDTISSPTTVITDASGSFTVSGCTVTDNAGNSASAIGSYEVLSSGGGGSLDSGGPSIKKIHLLPSVNPEDETKVEFDSGTGIKEIQIQVSSKASNVRIKVSKYDSKPAEVSKDISGKVYRYLEISAENLENKLEKVIVTIQVEKTWISDQGLNKEDVEMFKFDNLSENWNELETVFDSEDDNFYIYSIELDSFSFFVIGEKVKGKIGEVGEKPVTEKGFFESIREKVPVWLWWSLVFVLVVGIITVIYFIRKKGEEEINNSQYPSAGA